ncbi:hypothetical protein F4775DRAFT_282204 [Biscogniauxia sp. FL1348]|nr:hypothetical protein F4775DRAFT_282204 [Biscogniauxia sp. FL1348]
MIGEFLFDCAALMCLPAYLPILFRGFLFFFFFFSFRPALSEVFLSLWSRERNQKKKKRIKIERGLLFKEGGGRGGKLGLLKRQKILVLHNGQGGF